VVRRRRWATQELRHARAGAALACRARPAAQRASLSVSGPPVAV